MIPGIVSGRPVSGGGGGGGYPACLSSTPTGFETSALSHDVAMPASVDTGDLLIIQFGSSQGGTGFVGSAPAGWTTLSSGGGGSSSHRWGYYYRVADGTEGGTTVAVTMTVSSRAAAIVHRIQAGTHDAATAPEIASVQAVTDAPNPPALGPSWGSADTLWLMAFTSYETPNGLSYPYPDGNTLARSSPTISGNAYAIGASCWSKQSSSSFDPDAFSRTSSIACRSVTIAIKPA